MIIYIICTSSRFGLYDEKEVDISPSPILQEVKSIGEIDKEMDDNNDNNLNKNKNEGDNDNNNSQQESVDVHPSQVIKNTIVKDGNW